MLDNDFVLGSIEITYNLLDDSLMRTVTPPIP